MRKSNYIVWILGLIELILAVLIGIKVYPMLPAMHFWILVALEGIFLVLVLFSVKKVWTSVVMSILTIIMIIVLIIGYRALDKVSDLLDKVTSGGSKETIEMSLIVDAEDAAENAQDLAGREVGYLTEEVSEGAKGTKEQLDAAVEGIIYVEYPDIVSMINDLLQGEVDALIINEAFLAILQEQDDYMDINDRIKVIATYTVEGTAFLPKDVFGSESESSSEAETETESVTESETEVETETETESESSSESAGNNSGSTGNNSGNSGSTWQPPVGPSGFLGSGMENSAINDGTFIVYLSGIDTTGGPSTRHNSDVNILAAVNMRTRTIQLINTPRDYYIVLPNSKGQLDKLTHAGCHSIESSVGALENLYGINIDYYVKVNFSGFKQIIDAIGGIDVYSEYAFGNLFVKGMNHLDGTLALIFARERSSFATGDNQRGKNQMAVITGMVQKMTSPEWLGNYQETLDAISSSFVTNFSSEEIYALVKDQLENPTAWTVQSYAVTGFNGSDYCYSMPNIQTYVMIPNYDTVNTAKAKINEVLK